MRMFVQLLLVSFVATHAWGAIEFRNEARHTARVEVALTSGNVVMKSTIAPGKSISWGINGRVYQVTFLDANPNVRVELASTTTRNVNTVTLRQSGKKYSIVVGPSLVDGPVGNNCWRGLSIGFIRNTRAFSMRGTNYFLSGNLRNVPLSGSVCICGRMTPAKGKGDFALPTIQVSNLCP